MADNSLKALHSTVWPSMSRDGTNSNSCDVTSPPFSPISCLTSMLLVTGFPSMYQSIVHAGLAESVEHVKINLLTPFAFITLFPVMLVNRGETEVKQHTRSHLFVKDNTLNKKLKSISTILKGYVHKTAIGTDADVGDVNVTWVTVQVSDFPF